jgi:peptidoglycan/LPS O-acetylase OafA/YrhL
MAGALLAQLRFSGVVNALLVKERWFRTAGVFSFAALGVLMIALRDRFAFLEFGMHTVVAVLAAVLVCVAVYAPPRFLTSPIMRYVGTRSYALYLWHYPIILWLHGLAFGPELLLSLLLTFLAAELSWQVVERRGCYAARLGGVIARGIHSLRRAPRAIGPSGAEAG